MAIIITDECINCGACEPECPVSAIFDDEESCIEEEGNSKSVDKNYEFFGLKWEG